MGYASKRRASSAPLMLTFVIGIGVGFSLGYAVFAALQWDFSGKEHVVQVPAPPPEPAPAPVPIPEPVEGVATPPESVIAGPEQHLFVAISGMALDDSVRELLAEHTPGGVVLHRENFSDEAQARTLVEDIRDVALSGKRRAAPIILWAWEASAEKESFPEGDLAVAIAACVGSRDAAAARSAGKAFANRLAAIGVDAVLGPSLDVFPEGAADTGEKTRTFGDSPALVTKLGIAFADGLLEGGVTPVFRHYPGFGAAKRVEGRLIIEQTEVRELAELMFPFAEAVAHKAPAIFVGHIATPALDRDHPTRPASLSPVLVQRVLRGQWAYEGVILADNLSRLPEAPERPLEALLVECIAAGCDAAVVGAVNAEQMASLRQALEAAVDEGGVLSPERLAVSRARLDLWAARIAAMKPQAATAADSPPQAPVPEVPAIEPLRTADTPVDEAPAVEKTSLAEEPVEQKASRAEQAPEKIPAVVVEASPASLAETRPQVAAETKPQAVPPAGPVAAPPGTRAVRHLIGRGETLHGIARRYNVRVEDLKAWNALQNDAIQFGRSLTVHVPDPDAAGTQSRPIQEKAFPPTALPLPVEDVRDAEQEESSPASRAADAKAVEEEMTTPLSAPGPVESEDFQYHVVGRGDTLRKIAAQYRTSEAKIIDLNNIENPNILRLGTRLKVPKAP